MTISEGLNLFQQYIVQNLPTVLADNNLRALRYVDNAPSVDDDEFTIGIYLASPRGEVYKSNEEKETIDIVMDCILDDNSENSSLPEKYLSATIDHLNSVRDSLNIDPYTAITSRVDLESHVNGFAICCEMTIRYLYDGML